MKTIGFIGGGNMARAIIDGIVRSKVAKKNEIAIFDVLQEKMEQYEKEGFLTCKDGIELCKKSDVIFLAVKPQNIDTVLPSIGKEITDDKLIVSIAAGISTSYIMELIGHKCRAIRVMPNIPLTVGHGAAAISCHMPATEDDFKIVYDIFSSMGCACRIDEDKMNEIIIVNGSSPAFVFYIMREILNYAQNTGISYETAKELMCHTFIGSAKMMMESNKTADELVKMVTSPGGTTQKSIDVFNERDLPSIMQEAFIKCADRAYELGK